MGDGCDPELLSNLWWASCPRAVPQFPHLRACPAPGTTQPHPQPQGGLMLTPSFPTPSSIPPAMRHGEGGGERGGKALQLCAHPGGDCMAPQPS